MTNIYSNLRPDIAARMRDSRERREIAGTNVHFINERGESDCFSFATMERADAFRAKLKRQGLQLLP